MSYGYKLLYGGFGELKNKGSKKKILPDMDFESVWMTSGWWMGLSYWDWTAI